MSDLYFSAGPATAWPNAAITGHEAGAPDDLEILTTAG